MIKPSNFENIQTGDFTPVTPGGHHMIIKQVREQQSKSGKPMLVILVDFAPNDSQPNYFSKLFESDVRPDKKWPHAGVIYVVSVDSDGQCSRNFKMFITSYERSNGCEVVWGDGPAFCDQFRGKRIGGVYGRVEDEYNGERKIRCIHRWFCEDAKADNAKAPADKLLPDTPAATAVPVPSVPAPVVTTATSIPEPAFTQVNTDDLPW